MGRRRDQLRRERLTLKRPLAALGLVLGLAGLAAQFAWSIPAYLDAGMSLPGSVIAILGYFTILTNIGVLLVYAAALTGQPAFFARNGSRAAVAMSIAVVCIVYHFVLASLWQPSGLLFFADITLHYVTPLFYGVWWLTQGRSGSSHWSDLPWWLIYPLVYLVYALSNGGLTGTYAYPFIDVGAKGATNVAISVGIMLALFAVVGLAVICADRMLPRSRSTQGPI